MNGPKKDEQKDEQKDAAAHGWFEVVKHGDDVTTVRIHDKDGFTFCRYALGVMPIDFILRKMLLWLVTWKWFDRFILLCIGFNSVLLAIYHNREDSNFGVNSFCNGADKVLTWIFILECFLKIGAMGFICAKKTYLRDTWNILDFVVVVSALIEMSPLQLGNVSFLRLFRVLRPLKSLNSNKEMKALVNTTLRSVPKLGHVAAMGLFIGLVFAIIGVTLMPGIFYHQCRKTLQPALVNGCWEWEFSEDAGGLCGGQYMCADVGGHCFGHELDQVYTPTFPDNKTGPLRGGPKWCAGSEPKKLNAETDFVHFDNLGGALLLIFQCTTMEGWTDLMYYVQDALKEYYLAWVYFILVVVVNSFFLLNVALAVVDEARDEFDEDEAEDQKNEEDAGRTLAGVHWKEREEGEEELLPGSGESNDLNESEGEMPPWINCKLVFWCRGLSSVYNENGIFQYFITLIITGNVVCMMLDTYPPMLEIQEPKDNIGSFFLAIFVFEMIVEILAQGPKGYITNPPAAFDGVVVIVSLVEEGIFRGGGEAGGLKALRTLRLFRVLNKFASRSPALRILLQSILSTAQALSYWLALFVLVLIICTLMWMNFFSNKFHFGDPDDLAELSAWNSGNSAQDANTPWCPTDLGAFHAVRGNKLHHHQDCIPRAHFDNFGWGFITIFQIMTGENWNTIMYAGMRALGWQYGGLYLALLLFGQILFLSLFLSMLLSKFDQFKEQGTEEHRKSKKELPPGASSASLGGLSALALVRSSLSKGSSDDWGEKKSSSKISHKPEGQAIPEDDEDEEIALPADEDDDTELPGQIPEEGAGGAKKKAHKVTPSESDHDDERCEKEAGDPKELRDDRSAWSYWPKDFSWFILHKKNPIRRAANWFLDFEVTLPWPKDPEKGEGPSLPLFDNFILVCIGVSTLCMMLDYPLADPEHALTGFVRGANDVFVIIFIIEMVVKLLAYPFFWGDDAYLKSAWNWLDGIVVLVSVITMAFPKGPSFLRTLRILRAFRPLRVIKRLKTLKDVVETIFKSMKELGVLLIVFLIFLLIFALLFMMYLSGLLYACSSTDIAFLKDANGGLMEGMVAKDFTVPLCLGTDVRNTSSHHGSIALGAWSVDEWNATGASCASGFTQWERATADTPICVARCDPKFDHDKDLDKVGPKYAELCPRRYAITEELPSRCDDPNRVITAQEKVGVDFVHAMQTWYTIPCAGSTPESVDAEEEAPMKGVSCREVFCGDKVSQDRKDECHRECYHPHPFFCENSCDGDNKDTPKCKSCLEECVAACECQEYCEPLIKDAALCHEQGASWGSVLAQDFNNVWNSMLTLTEISTTEGWVDVMYAACDATSYYVQPVRDSNALMWQIMFSLWIVLSFMFLINVAVGIIVDKFMSERENNKEAEGTMDDTQARWLSRRMAVVARKQIFDLENLDQIAGTCRLKVYRFVTHAAFDTTIMTCILLNTVVMSLQVFPGLSTPETAWWRSLTEGLNLVFSFIFTVEAVLKFIALRRKYWKDSWNLFDFTCVVATIGGIILKYSKSGINISTLASVVRIFRIARLFRLLKFKCFRPMNKLFQSLGLSLVKLANVGFVAFLFLVLFSILGVNLFGTASQEEDTLNKHGNFKNFWYGFLTLFRAATGEAWNNIMHDLHKDEENFFAEGRWCSPETLFDWQDKYHVLKDKCLIDRPNACVTDIFGWNPFPAFYWVGYTLFIGLVIMNIVVAVILEGYEESKSQDEGQIIDTCRTLWRRRDYDPEHTMNMKKLTALRFIFETLQELQKEGIITKTAQEFPIPAFSGKDSDLKTIKQKFANALDLGQTPDMSFYDAIRQVFRLIAIINEDEADGDILKRLDKLDMCDELSSNKEVIKVKSLEEQKGVQPRRSMDLKDGLKEDIAARKLQGMLRVSGRGSVRKESSEVSADSPDGKDDLAPRKAG